MNWHFWLLIGLLGLIAHFLVLVILYQRRVLRALREVNAHWEHLSAIIDELKQAEAARVGATEHRTRTPPAVRH